MSMLLSSSSLASAACARHRRLMILRSSDLKSNSLGDRIDRLRNCNTLKGWVQEFPELRDLISIHAAAALAAPVTIQNKSAPDARKVVSRRALLAASTSPAAVQEFLKQELGVPANRPVKVTCSQAEEPGSGEVEVNEQLLEEHTLPYLVGWASGWFLTDV